MTKKTNWRKKVFNWHMWAGIIFSIPVFLVALTAIFIAHEDGLGTKNILVKAGWLPGYQAKQENINHFLNDVKAFLVSDSISYYGTKLGLIEKTGTELILIKGTEGAEVRDILSLKNSLFVATKYGIYRYSINDGKAIKVKNGDFHGLQYHEKKLIALGGKHGIIESIDEGKTWSEYFHFSSKVNQTKLSHLVENINRESFIERLNWQKLIIDIHTGEAFFGKNSRWVWIDLTALSLLFMTLTGIWMWYKRKFKKRTQRSIPLTRKTNR